MHTNTYVRTTTQDKNGDKQLNTPVNTKQQNTHDSNNKPPNTRSRNSKNSKTNLDFPTNIK
jgi:hypothetical protein